MEINLKFFILLLIIIFLIIFLTKKKDNFKTKGCIVDLNNPTEKDIFECYFSDLKDFAKKSSSARVTYTKKLVDRIQNYFIKLYYYRLEKQFRTILIFVPAKFDTTNKLRTVINYKIKDFMEKNKNKNFKYYLNNETPRSIIIGRNQMPHQMNGIFIGLGIKILVSNSEKIRCHYKQRNPNSGSGFCIPENPKEYKKYIPGPKYYTFMNLQKYSGNNGDHRKIHRHLGNTGFKSWKSSTWTNSGCGDRLEQRDWQWHKKVDSCMSSCYAVSRDTCYKAYGHSNLKKIKIIIDPYFFKKFYDCPKKDKEKYRIEFGKNNFNSIQKFMIV
tara:strand:- start:1150 stop:2133 length:984 start_codon:yes stop_codon:yes gene_type:complete